MTLHSAPASYAYADPVPSRAKRSIPRSSQGHFVGQSDFWRDGSCQVYGFESLLEFRVSLIAIYRPDFRDLEEQVGPIVFRRPNGKAGLHFLDFRLTLVGGRRVGLVVKPWRRAVTEAFRADVRALHEAAVPHHVDRLCVVTERNLDPVVLANAQLFHDARAPAPDLDAVVMDDLRTMDRITTIGSFLVRSGRGGSGYFPVIRLIRGGFLSVRSDVRIGYDTVIKLADD